MSTPHYTARDCPAYAFDDRLAVPYAACRPVPPAAKPAAPAAREAREAEARPLFREDAR